MYRSLNHYRILNKLSNEKLLRSCACIIRTKVNFHCNIRYSSEMFETWKERKELAETEEWWFAILSGYLLFKYLKWWNISKRYRYHTRANRRMRKAFESHKGTCRRQFVAFCSTVRFQRLPNNVLLALGIDERIEDILLLVVARLKVSIDDEGESLLRLKLEITRFIIIRGKPHSRISRILW